MSIKLLLTGGTIDKHYNQSNGELTFVDSHLAEILKIGRNQAEIEIEQLMLIDSLDMDDTDREVIKNACKKASQKRILITHGTDTMVETADYLAKNKLGKTIVLVGAMIPYVFKDTDAVFNVGFALAAVQTLSPGVYVTMNGKVFEWDKVIKNRKIGVFEDL
jgi:L-asparaginase